MATNATTVSRRRVGSRLRRAREAAGYTTTQVAARLGVSQPGVSRIERGHAGVKPPQLDMLVELYGIDDKGRDELADLSQRQERGWWTRFASVLRPGYYSYCAYESEASRITTWEPTLIPGYLQTEGYYRAMMAGAGGLSASAEHVEKLLAVRLERQAHLAVTRPHIETIIGEPVLRWVVGGTDVMTEQLDRLLEATREHTVRVVPFYRGADIAGIGGITVLGYEDLEDVVWGDTVAGDSCIEDDRPDQCIAAVEHLRSAALGEVASRDLIRAAREG